MKQTILAFILIALTSSCDAAGFIVMGDSLSALEESWPTYVEARHQVHAQVGRTVRDFNISDDLSADTNFDTIVYFLGGNDGIFFNTPDHVLRMTAEAHWGFLKLRGFRVLVVLPPKFKGVEDSMWRVRRTLREVADSLELETIDIQPIWVHEQTYDGAHPMPELSRAIAELIESRL